MTLIELIREVGSHLGHTTITPSQVGSTSVLTDASGASPLSPYDSSHLFNNTWASDPTLNVRRVNLFTPETQSLALNGPLTLVAGDIVDIWSYAPPVSFGLKVGIREYINRVLAQCYRRNLVPMGLAGLGTYTGTFTVNANVYKSPNATVAFISYGTGDITISAAGMTDIVVDVTTPGVYSQQVTLPDNSDALTVSGGATADVDCLSVRPSSLKWFFYSPFSMVESLEIWGTDGTRSDNEISTSDGEVGAYSGAGLVMLRGYESYLPLTLPADTTTCSTQLIVAGALAMVYEDSGESAKALAWRKTYNSLRRFLPRPKKNWMVVP